jgi:hypothetical protein
LFFQVGEIDAHLVDHLGELARGQDDIDVGMDAVRARLRTSWPCTA